MKIKVEKVDGQFRVTDENGEPLDWVDSFRILPSDDGELMLCLCSFRFTFDATLGATPNDGTTPAPAPAA
jgi:hypothetical protein